MDNREAFLLKSRRHFISKTLTAIAALSVSPQSAKGYPGIGRVHKALASKNNEPEKSIIGQYGPWAASLQDDPPALSYRLEEWKAPEQWRTVALQKTLECIAPPLIHQKAVATLVERREYDGMEIELLQWQLPYGRPTEAILLKPAGENRPLPGILCLHDHGGNKYFGKRKITRISDDDHPSVKEHQEDSYQGRAWANELAKRGYIVLVNDAFTFGSRRVKYGDVAGINWGFNNTVGRSDENPEDPENIRTYNEWAGHHEHIMAKSLFCAGTTWPGVFLAEDQFALDVLCAREDVDSERIGCAGLSGGGLRTVYLSGIDERIKCAVAVGFMSTWRDFLLNKAYTHTWMTYTPILPKYLDFPEIMGLRVPLPAMVQNCSEDPLYTMPEVERADRILSEIYNKAGAGEKYQFNLYEGGHKFDIAMQEDAFNWFDRWFK